MIHLHIFAEAGTHLHARTSSTKMDLDYRQMTPAVAEAWFSASRGFLKILLDYELFLALGDMVWNDTPSNGFLRTHLTLRVQDSITLIT